ncbi:MAG: hypothetical protein PHI35_01105 [Victivallaceae bacterium]|nr:hypothetical protein [Victivallaceae bacterium]
MFRLSVLLAVTVSLCYVFFGYDIYRDSASVYAYCARELGFFNWYEGVAARVPMLNIVLSGGLCMLGCEAYRATVIVACAFYVGVLFLLRPFLLRYLTPLEASWGCLLYVAAPKIIRFAGAGLIDSARIFFIIFALLFFFRSMEKNIRMDFVWFGVALGGLAVSRGEGMPAALILVLLWFPCVFLLRRSLSQAWYALSRWGNIAIAIIVFAVVISPFCLLNYHLTGFAVTDLRAVEIIDQIFHLGIFQPVSPAAAPVAVAGVATAAVAAVEPAWYAGMSVGLNALLNTAPRGCYELYLFFAAIGAAVIVARRKWRLDYWVMFLLVAMHLVIYYRMVSAYRYYIFMIPMFMMFTVSGAGVLLAIIRRYWPGGRPVVWVACAAVLIAQLVNGMSMAFSRDDSAKRELGVWIAGYGEREFPGRRLRLVESDCIETAYWSGAIVVNGYNHPPVGNIAVFRDCDLIVLARDCADFAAVAGRADVELLNAPYRDYFAVYRIKR